MIITSTGDLSIARGETWRGPVMALSQDGVVAPDGTIASPVDVAGWTFHGRLVDSTGATAADLTIGAGTLVLVSGPYLYPLLSAAATWALAAGTYTADFFAVDTAGVRVDLAAYRLFLTTPATPYP